LDVDVCGYTAHSLATGCSRCEDNYNMLSSEKIHSANCSYYSKILPSNYAIAKVRDEKAMEKELLQGSVVHMYKIVIDRAKRGEGYVVKPPPTMKYCK
jgi:pyruvoyl-dependent arginine decarboxylase (PvlArgDC)